MALIRGRGVLDRAHGPAALDEVAIVHCQVPQVKGPVIILVEHRAAFGFSWRVGKHPRDRPRRARRVTIGTPNRDIGGLLVRTGKEPSDQGSIEKHVQHGAVATRSTWYFLIDRAFIHLDARRSKGF